MALTALVSGVIGVVTAGLASVGLIEEAAKLIAPLAVVIYTRHRHRHLADGLLVGVASGTGSPRWKRWAMRSWCCFSPTGM